MRKIYFIAIALFASITISAQTVIDISTINAAYTTTFDGALVIDVAKTASKVANPNLSFENPFKALTFTEAEISFDVFNYGDIKVLGALFAIFDEALGRMYFTNGSYLGYNATGGWFDANLIDYGMGTNFIGSNVWKNIKLQFTTTGYAMYVDNNLAFDQNSTDVNIATDAAAPFTDYNNVISFFQNAAKLVIGTGSWWSDNTQDDGSYWDPQFSYLKNINFTPDFSKQNSVDQAAFKPNGEVIGLEFYNITGVKVGSEFNALKPGIYIKRSVYSNGAVKSSKMIKGQ